MLDLMTLGPGPMLPSGAKEGSHLSEGGDNCEKGRGGRGNTQP